MISYGALLIGFFIYATRVPAVRGIRGEPRYRTYLSLDGVWIGTLFCAFIVFPIVLMLIFTKTVNSIDSIYLYDRYYVAANAGWLAAFGLVTLIIAVFILLFD